MADKKTHLTANAGEALAAPLGAMIAAVGRGVAEAQEALDAQTLRRLKAMYRADDEMLAELRRLGYSPTWFRIPEAEADISVSLTVSGESTSAPASAADAAVGGHGRVKLYAAPVDASYANKYGFEFRAASRVRFKIVAVPASAQVTDLRVVPKLHGPVRRAVRLLEELDIAYELRAKGGQVTNVRPREGTVLAPGQKVILR